MSRVTLHAQAQRDVIRLTDFLFDSDPAAAVETAELLRHALRILERHPAIGRRVSARIRELVIHRGRAGYLALYRVSSDDQEVEVLAIRHQRESGYHGHDL
ncbi:MAG: type II toxin-antitoxin system RelE/ParE family toxin [Comamonadaceae bacterium]|nr:MAG: type II toxin-antitoxin system RelE/ParE family toxin [Comamonadaceae bacterium]